MKRFFRLNRTTLPILLVLLSAMLAAPEQDPRSWSYERKSVVVKDLDFGQGRMELRQGIRILHLHGSAYAMGYQHGSMMAQELKLLQEDAYYYMTDYGSRVSNMPRLWVRLLMAPRLTTWAQIVSKNIPEHHLQEMQGIADGSGRSFNDILLLNLVFDKNGLRPGSALAAGPGATKAAKLWHGYNFDLTGPRSKFIDNYKAVIFYHPDGQNSFVSIGYLGQVGVYTGFNEKGISVSWQGIDSALTPQVQQQAARAKKPATPYVFALREVLEQAQTIDRAAEILKLKNRPLCDSVIIAARDEGKAIALETFATASNVLDMSRGAVFSVNCFQSPQMAPYAPCPIQITPDASDTENPELAQDENSRQARFSKLLQDRTGRIGLPEMLEIMRDPYPAERYGYIYTGRRAIASSLTNFSVIYNLSDNLFWVALNNPPAPLGQWIGMNFKTETIIKKPKPLRTIPATGFFHLKNGINLFEQEDWQKARHQMTKALESDNENLVARYYLARCALELRDTEKAKKLTEDLKKNAVGQAWQTWTDNLLAPDMPSSRPSIYALKPTEKGTIHAEQ